jgi:hypothetical protein
VIVYDNKGTILQDLFSPIFSSNNFMVFGLRHPGSIRKCRKSKELFPNMNRHQLFM